ncbi:MAG: hypothetical protein ACPH56_09620, partial [Spongiibacter marinus]
RLTGNLILVMVPKSGERSYLLAEAWLGYTFALSRHYTLSYVARVQSSEIQGGKGDRLLSWGGLVLSRTL